MTKFAISASVAALCLGAAPAFAELSPEQTWDEIIALYGSLYENVSHDAPRREGDTLVVENLQITYSDSEMSMDVGMAEMRLQAVDADTVEITLSETIDFDLQPVSDEIPGDIDLAITQSGTVITASGEPGAITWAYQADAVEASANFAGIEGAGVFAFDLALRGYTGMIATSQTGDLYALEGEYAVESLTFDFNADGPRDEAVSGNGELSGLAAMIDAALPLDMMEAGEEPDPSALFDAGFRMVADMTTGPLALAVQGNTRDTGQFDLGLTNASAQVDVNVSSEGIDIQEDFEGLALNLTSDQLPFPVEGSLGSIGFGFKMPALQDQPGQDMGFRISLIDLVVSDTLWGLFDPQAHLPRDPASLALTVTATGTPLVNIFDEDAAKEADDFPFKMETATLERLLVSVIGAELTGSGDFTFGPEPSPAFGGMQPVSGMAQFSLTGLNAALDNLVATGLVPAEQLMGVRMGLGRMAVPDGDDRYKSEIELREDGAVLVNGNRMR